MSFSSPNIRVDLARLVLANLPYLDLSRAALLSIAWKAVSDEPDLWRRHAKVRYNAFHILTHMDPKAAVKRIHVRNADAKALEELEALEKLEHQELQRTTITIKELCDDAHWLARYRWMIVIQQNVSSEFQLSACSTAMCAC
jgi:hypothetical protein